MGNDIQDSSQSYTNYHGLVHVARIYPNPRDLIRHRKIMPSKMALEYIHDCLLEPILKGR